MESSKKSFVLNHLGEQQDAFLCRGRGFSFIVMELGTHSMLPVSFLNLRNSALLPPPSLSKCTHMPPTFVHPHHSKDKGFELCFYLVRQFLPITSLTAFGKADHLFLLPGSSFVFFPLALWNVCLSLYFLFGFFLYLMKNPVDNPLLPIFSKPQMPPPNTAWQSFGLKQTSGGCGQNINSHLSEL